MSGITIGARVGLRRRSAAAIAVALAGLLVQQHGTAQGQDALPYSRGYLVTGDYVAAGVDFTETTNPPNANGLSTGTIDIVRCNPPSVIVNCIPADADIVAAYLYWEAIVANGDLKKASGVQFRGEDILLNDVAGVKYQSQDLTGSTSSCWSSGAPLKMVGFRADVLRFLPIRRDADDKPTGKRLVTNEDLTEHGLPLHSVRLPTRNGNQIPESAGASLVIVYRDLTEPLRKIVFYDGLDIQTSLTDTMTQTLRGFYQSSTSRSAKITHLIGGGQPNNNEVISFNVGSNSYPISPLNPIAGATSSQRSWSTLTYNVGDFMNPPAGKTDLSGYGETVTTTLAHTPANGGYDCLAWSAVIFSTAVADRDQDGVPDGLEDSSSGLIDADGEPLPNLHAMGTTNNPVNSDGDDVFMEINAMQTDVQKNHGSPAGPYPGTVAPAFSKPVPKHTHIPTPEVLAMIGHTYKQRGIRVHFDVGNITSYKARGKVAHPAGPIETADWVDDYTSGAADDFLIASGATGGEVIDERACNELKETCVLGGYPGTVSWKVGLQLYRDAPVRDDDGSEFLLNAQGKLVVPSTWQGRRRFDKNRKGLFHYILYAHYRGKRRSDLPCLITATGTPSPLPTGKTNCTGPGIKDNPDFYRPSSASGVADLPGGNAMITLGFWEDFVGRPFVQASTTFHELGHNYNLWHGGAPAIWGDSAKAMASFIEPNCKPNYLSAMSYLFQVHGLYTNDDELKLDFSGTAHTNLSESTPETDAQLLDQSYRTAWYAPFTSELATSLGAPEAKRYCHGESFGTPQPSIARVYTLSNQDVIDWNGDGNNDQGDNTHADPNQDINFDHGVNPALLGFDDWGSLRLDQISAGRNAVKFQDGDFLDFGSGDFLDFGSGDFLDFGSGDFLDFGSGDFLDFGSGDFLDFGSGILADHVSGDFLDFGSGDFLDFGSGDFLDFGSGDFLDFGSGSERQELDFELAKDLGRTPPFGIKGCVVTENAATDCVSAPAFDPLHHRPRLTWKAPSFGRVSLYEVSRKRGPANSTYPFVAPVPVSTSTTTAFVDRQELPNGEFFTYRTRASFDDNVASGYSKTVTLQAQNEPPVVNKNGQLDAYTTAKNKTLTVNDVTKGVRANDEDPDSPKANIVTVLVAQPPNGTVTLNANGTFTYKPKNGFTGEDRFQYKANNGTWTLNLPNIPMNSTDSLTVDVVITVTAK